MATPNVEKWGDSTQWQIDTNVYPASGVRDSDYAFYNGKRLTMGDYITGGEMAYNTPIDTSICYAAHASDTKMPLADIALIGNKDGSVIATQTMDCGWFLGSQNGASRGDWQTFINLEGIKNGTPEQQITTARAFLWSPNGTKTGWWAHDNNHEILKPIVKFNLRSFFGVVRVVLITNDHKTQTNISLKTLKDNINTYKNTHYIGSVYMTMRCYQGGDSANGFTNFSNYNANNFGSAIIKPFKINDSNTEILSYYQTVNSDGQLPIANIPYPERLEDNYGNYVWGVGAYTHTESTSSRYRDVSYPVYMYHLVDRIDIVDGAWNSTILCPVIPITAEVIDELYKGAAAYGIFFSDDYYNLANDTTNTTRYFDENMLLGVLDENGVGHGEYTKGLDNINNPVFQWTDSTQSPYDPTIPIDPNTYSDTTNWNNVNFQQAFTKRYLLNAAQVGQLAGELWAAQSSKPADIDYNNFAIDEYLTNNPIDTIVSLKYFPCTFADVAPAVVHLGKYTTNIAATALGTSVRIIDFAPIECFQHFGDFRDYEPYTELAMYIPFCGTVKIPTAECMGNYVSVKLAIDTSTGAATGYVIVSKTGSGGICVATCQGMAAIDIPVSGLQSANLANAVFNATANWTQTQVNNISANSGLFKHMGGTFGTLARGMSNSFNLSDVKGGVLGGPIGAIGTLANSLNPISALQKGMNIDIDNAKADYELSHIQVPTRLVGSASPVLGCVIELDCRLIIYRPVTDETALSNYADTVGYATVQGGTVSQFKGFTVGTIDVSGINATSKEKQAIAAAFANGVYL